MSLRAGGSAGRGTNVAVIGGGFFGLFIAEWLAQQGARVSIVEASDGFMGRASYANQARVHNGYHYPRSILTGLRSRISFPRFVQDFRPCIEDQFEKYYLIGRLLGNVTARQFEQFCSRIGAPCDPASARITRLVNPDLITAAYRTEECAFDAIRLRDLMVQRIAGAGVTPLLQTTVDSVRADAGGRLSLRVRRDGHAAEELDGFDHVFNCTYSMINGVNRSSGLEVVPLKHEVTELCLVEVPAPLRACAVTVMCGPFFSFMPFPPGHCHSFSHVRYTPHYSWTEAAGGRPVDPHEYLLADEKKSAWSAMRRDAARYVPILAETRHLRSLWEIKTVLPRSESDDSRPILFKPNHGLRGFHCVMGAKIDNAYDAVAQIERLNLLARGDR